MQTSMQTVLVLLLATLSFSHADEVTPVQKVIQMMNGMLEKAKAEKNAQQVEYAQEKQWCDDTIGQKPLPSQKQTR
jgi:hypothetical protein